MPSFRGWVCNEVAKLTKGFHKPTMDETFTVIRHDAEMRGRSALLKAMGAQNQFHVSADFHHAVNVLVQAVVAGVFGEIPLTDEEKAAKLQFFKTIMGDMPKFAGPYWSPKETTVASGQLTVADLQKAAEQIKAAGYGPVTMGSPKGPHVGQVIKESENHWKVWDGQKWVHAGPELFEAMMTPKFDDVIKAKKAGKSGLPAAKDAVQAQEAALDELWAVVEKKSDELLGIKQKAKYEELVGIDPEEI